MKEEKKNERRIVDLSDQHIEIIQFLKAVSENYWNIPIRARKDGKWQSLFLHECNPYRVINWIHKSLMQKVKK